MVEVTNLSYFPKCVETFRQIYFSFSQEVTLDKQKPASFFPLWCCRHLLGIILDFRCSLLVFLKLWVDSIIGMYDQGGSMWQAPGMFQLQKRTKKPVLLSQLCQEPTLSWNMREIWADIKPKIRTQYSDEIVQIPFPYSRLSVAHNNIYCQSRFKMSAKLSNNSCCFAP